MPRSFQSQLETWMKNRTVLIVVSVFGLIGIQAIAYVLIDQHLGSRILEANANSVVLQETADQLERQTQEVKARAKKALDSASAQEKKIEDQLRELTSKASSIDQRLREVLKNIDAASQNVRSATLVDIQSLQE
jgi:septal ring factor EnvC (AmiA/AmiB activator)